VAAKQASGYRVPRSAHRVSLRKKVIALRAKEECAGFLALLA
jgi:hypothetical protein